MKQKLHTKMEIKHEISIKHGINRASAGELNPR